MTFKRYPDLEVVGISSGKSHHLPTRTGGVQVLDQMGGRRNIWLTRVDSSSAQATFVDNNNLSYPILSDPEDKTRKAYGVGKDLFGFVPGTS